MRGAAAERRHPAAWSLPRVTVTGRGAVPHGKSAHSRAAHAHQKQVSLTGNRSREGEAEFPGRPRGLLLNSYPLSLNFPAAALSCFPSREAGPEKDRRSPADPPGFLACSSRSPAGTHQPVSRWWGYILRLVVLFTALWLNPREPTPSQADTLSPGVSCPSPRLFSGIWETKAVRDISTYPGLAGL